MRLDRKKFACAMIDAELNTKQLAEKAGVARATACSIKNGKSCNYDIVNIGLHFFHKDVRPKQPLAKKHSTVAA